MRFVVGSGSVGELASAFLETVYRAVLPRTEPAKNPKYEVVIPAPNRKVERVINEFLALLAKESVDKEFVSRFAEEVLRQLEFDKAVGAVPVEKKVRMKIMRRVCGDEEV